MHIAALQAEPHLGTSFKHFLYFVDEFKLIDDKDLVPLAELIHEFRVRKQKPEVSIKSAGIASQLTK